MLYLSIITFKAMSLYEDVLRSNVRGIKNSESTKLTVMHYKLGRARRVRRCKYKLQLYATMSHKPLITEIIFRIFVCKTEADSLRAMNN